VNKFIYPLLVGLFLFLAILITATRPAGANHDTIYSPCGTEYGFIHMTYDEWAAHITTMEADGTIPPGIVFRYDEELHGGKGLEDPRVVWARNLTDGQILSIDDWANGNYPEIEALMFSSGLIPEWILDANKTVRRFNDPYWAQANPLTPTWTVWQSLCMANYGYSIPVMEINQAGVWESNIPTTSLGSSSTTSTSTTSTPPRTTTSTTTTTVAYSPPDPTPVVESSSGGSEVTAWDSSYDLYDAEWDGWPFEATIRLLEERYVPNTPNRYHFPMSTAVDYLRGGGMIAGLDHLWESP
jgi:hypothetical protein|tara:strand:- start:2085 stop:2978 length:894 start_codon:yes stop_codon:yes gene_type:complete